METALTTVRKKAGEQNALKVNKKGREHPAFFIAHTQLKLLIVKKHTASAACSKNSLTLKSTSYSPLFQATRH
jgi:hypothetical protein